MIELETLKIELIDYKKLMQSKDINYLWNLTD